MKSVIAERENVSTVAQHEAATAWQRWLHRPETLWLHKVLFHVHQWAGLGASLYILVLSLSGSLIVFRPQLENRTAFNSRTFRAVEWLVNLHENLLLGSAGRSLNGAGAVCLALVTLSGIVVWWPGMAHWRRSLTVGWKTSFARLNWDLHNALGFWSLIFVALWAISGAYFCFPGAFNGLVDLLEPPAAPPQVRFGDQALFWLSNLHFGRFTPWTEALWAAMGLVLALLAATGVVMYCHRLVFALPHPSRHWRFAEGEKPGEAPRAAG